MPFEKKTKQQRQKEKARKTFHLERIPLTNKFSIKDLFLKADLYKAIGLMLGQQGVLLLTMLAPRIVPMDKTWIITSIANLFGVGLVIVCLSIIRRENRDKKSPKFSWKIALFTNVLLILYVILIPIILSIFQSQGQEQPNQDAVNQLFQFAPFAMATTMIVIGPFIEETVFRLIGPKIFGQSWVSFIAFSLLFTLMHQPTGLNGWLTYGTLSFIFLYARLASKNTYNAIYTHICWNFFSYLIMVATITNEVVQTIQ